MYQEFNNQKKKSKFQIIIKNDLKPKFGGGVGVLAVVESGSWGFRVIISRWRAYFG